MTTEASKDQNDVSTLLGVSNSDGNTPVKIWASPSTHRLLVDSGGTTGTFVDNEVVSGSGTSWTLSGTPISGSQHIYANGQRLTPGAGNDYTISGAVITTTNSFSAGQLLADFRE